MKRSALWRTAAPLALLLAGCAHGEAADAALPADVSGAALASGAAWSAKVPANWNGTLLLWSRGYSPVAGAPDVVPPQWREALLARGYALAGSNYGASGWALAEAVPAQEETVATFAARYGAPRRVIGWGYSMGGLVSTALAEREVPVIDGAIAMCPSIGGAVGMLNMALDGAFVFVTLQAPESGLQLVGIVDDRANGQRAAQAVAQARQSAAGRARLALAGVIGGLPAWTVPGSTEPAASDVEAQLDQMAEAFTMGIFVPRADQEARAGGVTSWNTGIDYSRQLALSGRRGFVEAFYRTAGLDLDADLARLAAAPRIAADPAAVQYLMAHYTPDGRPQVPLISLQAVGDGLTSPSLQSTYVDGADPALVRGLWLDRAGHCGFEAEAALTALVHLEQRLDRGTWPALPAGTVPYQPAPMLRPCRRGGTCE